MKILIHKAATKFIKVISPNGEGIVLSAKNSTDAFWKLAEEYPEEIIGWCEEDLQEKLATENWEEIFHHNLIMASYAIKTTFLPDSIGYIDQLPFINVSRQVQYGTWIMSSDIGGIKGEVLLRFKPLFGQIDHFEYLLNSISKVGQQNSLFCYSVPKLIRQTEFVESNQAEPVAAPTASTSQLFRFVYQHYNSAWAVVLLFSFLLYEKSFPCWPYLKSLFSRKFFRKKINFSRVVVHSRKKEAITKNIDVIIPTLGRANYLHDVLKDFAQQTHLPSKVIIVEQNPEQNSISELDFLQQEWPFEIIHHFVHRTGACFARNIALKEVTSEWIFFADDDIRMNPNLLEDALAEIGRLGISAININCKQKGEKTVFPKIKQWGSFGSGTSIVAAKYAKKCKFSIVFEHGNGEDVDFGNQLRKKGCDIIYHPDLEMLHLKAGAGGFRNKKVQPWEIEEPRSKPSPTVMVYAQKHYTPEQLKGYKISLFLKFYSKQSIKNPFSYLIQMKNRWRRSQFWANKLIQEEN